MPPSSGRTRASFVDPQAGKPCPTHLATKPVCSGWISQPESECSAGNRFRNILAKLVDLDLAVRETRYDLQFAPHCLDEAAQRPDVQVGALFHLGDRSLINVEDRR